MKSWVKIFLAGILILALTGGVSVASEAWNNRLLGAAAGAAAVGVYSAYQGGGCASSRACGYGGYTSPYDQAYAAEAYRIQRQQQMDWIRQQQNLGRAAAMRDYGYGR